MEKFALGVMVGGICGALLTANNYKMRTLVRKAQEEVQAKFDQMLDEKTRAMDAMTDEIKAETEEAKRTATTAKKRVGKAVEKAVN